MRLELGSAPAPGAADDALVVGFCVGTSALMGSSIRVRFGARARRTTAGAAVLPVKPADSFRLSLLFPPFLPAKLQLPAFNFITQKLFR